MKKLKSDIYKAMEKRGRRGVRNNVQETYASIQDYAEGLGVTLDGDDLDPGLGEGGNDASGIDDEQGRGQQPAFSSHTVFSALDEIRVSCTLYLVSALLYIEPNLLFVDYIRHPPPPLSPTFHLVPPRPFARPI